MDSINLRGLIGLGLFYQDVFERNGFTNERRMNTTSQVGEVLVYPCHKNNKEGITYGTITDQRYR